MFPMDMVKINDYNKKEMKFYVIPERPVDLSDITNLVIKMWFGDSEEAWYFPNEDSFVIEFDDEKKQLIVEGIIFDVIEKTEWAYKFSKSRFKKKTVKTGCYYNLKKHIVESTYDDLFSTSMHMLFSAVVKEHKK